MLSGVHGATAVHVLRTNSSANGVLLLMDSFPSLDSSGLTGQHDLRLCLTRGGVLACLHALVPRVRSLRVAFFSAGLVPTAPAGAARAFAGIVGDALGTRGGGSSSSGCCCCAHIYVGIAAVRKVYRR